MRLGTCIALELAVAASTVAGVWLGTGQLATRAGDYLETRSAAAAPFDRGGVIAPEAMPRPQLPLNIETRAPANNIFGVADDELLAPLGVAKVSKIKFNHGGTSLSIRLDFANGVRASFKPEQTFAQSDPRREIAAYRIDRLLGIGHVSPTKEYSVPIADLLAVADAGFLEYYTKRITEEGVARAGVLHGELQWWIPEIKLAAIEGQRIDEPGGRAIWTEQLQIGVKQKPELRGMLAQISTCILYDLVIDNSDRWSGSNTEMSPDGKTLFFMDNTLSFSKATFGHEISVLSMRRIQMFPKKLVERLRKLTLEEIETALAMPADSKLAPLLKPFEIHAILARRDNMLKWIDQLIAKYGEDQVLAFP